MKLPGKAWLQFLVKNCGADKSKLIQTTFFGGQIFGKYLNKILSKNKNLKLSSCLVWDIVKNYQVLSKQ